MAGNSGHIRSRHSTQGFTLIELMIALAILTILLAVAVPSFSTMIKKNRVESTIRELGGALSLARTEAVSRGKTVTFCRSTNGTGCATGTSATAGWLVFEDGDADGTVDSGDTVLRVRGSLTNTRLTMTNDALPTPAELLSIQFNRHGFSNERMTFGVCESDQETDYARALLMENTGRISSAGKNTSTGIYKDVNGADLTCP